MKIVIPMAGIGKRLRPFTLTTAKPLLKIAGKSIVQRLVEQIISVSHEKVTEVGFIIGDFPESVVDDLKELGEQLEFKVNIYVQDVALGTAHALSFANEMLSGKVIVAFADTLFDADFRLKVDSDVVIWTKQVKNPEAYGVVIKEGEELITGFFEKPKKFISDEAIIGIYYFKDASVLSEKIEYVISNKMLVNNEYQLTDALQFMLNDGCVFVSQTVDTWLDCGSKDLLINTADYVLQHFKVQSATSYLKENSVIIPPVYLGDNVLIKNSVIGPNVCVENNSVITGSVISNSIVLEDVKLENLLATNSMFGNSSAVKQSIKILDVGDYDKLTF
ncbi:MAG: hypothetical protein JXL97_13130 [Bacteroidales bacterium]|nr:hypothetical protein [Bacteroidales bacterium]